jgi:PAS domain S-box-containing protein
VIASLRILVVDDSEEDVALLLHALHRAGYEPVRHTVVSTEADFRAALAREEWDVVTSDHAMPRFSAPAVLQLLREINPELPLIIVSGEIDLDLAVSLVKGGAQDYIPKRELSRLPAVIDRSLKDRQVRRERQRDADTLRASETRYRRLFETAQDGILLIDATTEEITDINPYLINLLGETREWFIGKKLWEIGFFTDTHASKQTFNELQASGYVRYDDLPLRTSSGTKIDVEFVSNSYCVDQRKVIQCNIRSITERKQAENRLRALAAQLEQRVKERTVQLEDLNRELETFSYSVSHDLRAPLRQIDGFTKILQEDYAAEASTRAVELTQRIRGSVKRMNALIAALLKLAHLPVGRLKREPVNLSAMAHQVADDLQQSEPERRVEWNIAEGAMTNADPHLLRVVLDNLLGNAWKFTAQRECAHIEFGVEPQADGSVAFFERDDGAGFDMKHADKLFGAFQRLHSGKEFPGTGIGLATVQRIIHRHGGRVWADSSIDHGATFWFTLVDDHKDMDDAEYSATGNPANEADVSTKDVSSKSRHPSAATRI